LILAAGFGPPHTGEGKARPSMTASLPRVYGCLAQGWNHAPTVTRACQSWHQLNPGRRSAHSKAVLDRYSPSGLRTDRGRSQEPGLPIRFASSSYRPRRRLEPMPPRCAPNRSTSGCRSAWERVLCVQAPTPDRMIASWFLAASVPCSIVARWRARVAGALDREKAVRLFLVPHLSGPSARTRLSLDLGCDTIPPAQHAAPFAEGDRRRLAAAPDYRRPRFAPGPVFKPLSSSQEHGTNSCSATL
jgi:hypothetical protein